MRPDQDLTQHWVCEHCEKPAVGRNPPDECPHCGHKYFDNLADIIKEKGQSN